MVCQPAEPPASTSITKEDGPAERADDVGDGPVSRICIFTLQWTYRFCVERRPTTLMDCTRRHYIRASRIDRQDGAASLTENNGTASIPPGLDYS